MPRSRWPWGRVRASSWSFRIRTERRKSSKAIRWTAKSSAAADRAPLYALTVAIALLVLQEGAETVLFVAGLLAGPNAESGSLLATTSSGLASQLAKTLNQADWVSALGEKAWDISAWISNDSALGTVLRGVVGFDANPSELQLLFYLVTVTLIGFSAHRMKMHVLHHPSLKTTAK